MGTFEVFVGAQSGLDQWLYAPFVEATKLVNLTPAEMMDAGPVE